MNTKTIQTHLRCSKYLCPNRVLFTVAVGNHDKNSFFDNICDLTTSLTRTFCSKGLILSSKTFVLKKFLLKTYSSNQPRVQGILEEQINIG